MRRLEASLNNVRARRDCRVSKLLVGERNELLGIGRSIHKPAYYLKPQGYTESYSLSDGFAPNVIFAGSDWLDYASTRHGILLPVPHRLVETPLPSDYFLETNKPM